MQEEVEGRLYLLKGWYFKTKSTLNFYFKEIKTGTLMISGFYLGK